MCKPEAVTGRDYGVRSHGMGAGPSRRAVSPVMRVRAKSIETDTLVSHAGCATPNKELDIAASELPLSTAGKNLTSAGSVHVLVEGTMAVEGAEDANVMVPRVNCLHHRRWCLRWWKES